MARPIPFDPIGLRPPPGRYLLDPERSTVEFTARALGFPIRGRFASVSGSIDLAEDPRESLVTVRVGAASLHTGNAWRDTHLRGAQFLDASVHPVLRFHSTHIQPADQDRWTVAGNLTVRGVTCPVALAACCLGWSSGGRLRFAAATTLDRTDFGVRGHRPLIAVAVAVAIHAEATPPTTGRHPQ